MEREYENIKRRWRKDGNGIVEEQEVGKHPNELEMNTKNIQRRRGGKRVKKRVKNSFKWTESEWIRMDSNAPANGSHVLTFYQLENRDHEHWLYLIFSTRKC